MPTAYYYFALLGNFKNQVISIKICLLLFWVTWLIEQDCMHHCSRGRYCPLYSYGRAKAFLVSSSWEIQHSLRLLWSQKAQRGSCLVQSQWRRNHSFRWIRYYLVLYQGVRFAADVTNEVSLLGPSFPTPSHDRFRIATCKNTDCCL